MKTMISVTVSAILLLLTSGCTTVTDRYGNTRSVMTPMGAAVVQTATATGIGAGTGAMMRGSNPVAIGAVSAGAGSIGSQAINAFIPKSN
jgi:uncharacterized protein YceK